MIKKCTLVITLSTGYACHILKKIEFFNRFSKNTQMSIVMELCQVEAELFRVDGRTDVHDEPNSCFSRTRGI